ncbi:hypothetical protein Ancab_016777 [Ancistrocladus abbreviatus]
MEASAQACHALIAYSLILSCCCYTCAIRRRLRKALNIEAEVTQRLTNAKEPANKPGVQSHKDLAKKLQDEMEKNHRAASGSSSELWFRDNRVWCLPASLPCECSLDVNCPLLHEGLYVSLNIVEFIPIASVSLVNN